MRIVLADRPSADSHTCVCVSVVMGVSEGVRLYGSKRFVISRSVRLFKTEESLSGVFFIGDEGTLCSDSCSACTINEMILAAINKSSLYEYVCL